MVVVVGCAPDEAKQARWKRRDGVDNRQCGTQFVPGDVIAGTGIEQETDEFSRAKGHPDPGTGTAVFGTLAGQVVKTLPQGSRNGNFQQVWAF